MILVGSVIALALALTGLWWVAAQTRRLAAGMFARKPKDAAPPVQDQILAILDPQDDITIPELITIMRVCGGFCPFVLLVEPMRLHSFAEDLGSAYRHFLVSA